MSNENIVKIALYPILMHNIHWRAPKLLDGLKCEFKVKTSKEQGVEACSLTRNTLGVERHAGAPKWD
jgi:hypothetical protein